MNIMYEIPEYENAKNEVREFTSLVAELEKGLKGLREAAQFLTVEDVSKLTGIGLPQVREIFRRPDFPCTDYGKRKVVMLKAFVDYFSKPVKQSDFK